MANFIDKVKSSAQNMGKAVKGKTEEVSAIVKINKETNEKKVEIEKLKYKIGQAVYDSFVSGGDLDSNIENCKAIQAAEKRIEELKVELLNAKGIKKCVKCGEDLALDMPYCYSCGAKQPVRKEDKPVF
jgi:hypothetical protein